MIKICTIDLDGTLFDKNKKISNKNKEAIFLAKENGCRIVIATGRPYHGVYPVLQELDLLSDQDYVICYNGAKVFNTKTQKLIFSSTILGSDIKIIYQIAQRYKAYFHAFRKNEELITDVHNPYTDVEVKINKIEDHIVDINSINHLDEFLKCMIVGPAELLDQIESQLNDSIKNSYSIVRSAPIFLEFLNSNTHKGAALKALASFLTISMKDTMAIGDAGNDLTMIKMAAIGVAMENSFPEIKKVARYVTTSNEASGVAQALNTYVNSKQG
ncbi:MAG: HAD family phosphatase [Acholeplasmatales bacterium]|jgi:Cof subfamily protein (haloacid dehalogenase superfamily)|nr:HAD family phosphatase [Acholeplasmatales bacterium]